MWFELHMVRILQIGFCKQVIWLVKDAASDLGLDLHDPHFFLIFIACDNMFIIILDSMTALNMPARYDGDMNVDVCNIF